MASDSVSRETDPCYWMIDPTGMCVARADTFGQAVIYCDTERHSDNERWKVKGSPAGLWTVHIEDGEVWTQEA